MFGEWEGRGAREFFWAGSSMVVAGLEDGRAALRRAPSAHGGGVIRTGGAKIEGYSRCVLVIG